MTDRDVLFRKTEPRASSGRGQNPRRPHLDAYVEEWFGKLWLANGEPLDAASKQLLREMLDPLLAASRWFGQTRTSEALTCEFHEDKVSWNRVIALYDLAAPGAFIVLAEWVIARVDALQDGRDGPDLLGPAIIIALHVVRPMVVHEAISTLSRETRLAA